jgi:hypothetical protein
MTDREYVEKTEKIFELFLQCDDELVHKFMDLDSNELLDEKIEVLTALVNGEAPADIPHYYDVLEKMPKTGNWD